MMEMESRVKGDVEDEWRVKMPVPANASAVIKAEHASITQ